MQFSDSQKHKLRRSFFYHRRSKNSRKIFQLAPVEGQVIFTRKSRQFEASKSSGWKYVIACRWIYSSFLKYRNSVAQNDKVQNQIPRQLSLILKIVSWKSFLEIYLVYKNLRLKFLKPILRKLKNASFRKIYLKFEFFRYLRGFISKFHKLLIFAEHTELSWLNLV